jgi:opacity protein-like surface antigen
MNVYAAVVAAAAVVVAAVPAAAADRRDVPYAAMSLGWHGPEDETTGNAGATVRRDDGFGAHAALGHAYNQFRGEAEIGWYRGNASPGGRTDTISLIAGLYYDIDTGTPFKPYVGGGVGLARVGFTNVTVPGLGTVDDNAWAMAWQLGMGVAYGLSDNVDLYAGYRWFDVANVKMETSDGSRFKLDDFGSHNVELGIRLRF